MGLGGKIHCSEWDQPPHVVVIGSGCHNFKIEFLHAYCNTKLELSPTSHHISQVWFRYPRKFPGRSPRQLRFDAPCDPLPFRFQPLRSTNYGKKLDSGSAGVLVCGGSEELRPTSGNPGADNDATCQKNRLNSPDPDGHWY